MGSSKWNKPTLLTHLDNWYRGKNLDPYWSAKSFIWIRCGHYLASNPFISGSFTYLDLKSMLFMQDS